MREGRGRGLTDALVAFVCAIAFAAATAHADPSLLRGLDTDDPRALADAVTAIERAPTTPELADTLFAAGRACEDRLYDPARALAIYERIVRELPDAGVSIAAARRIDKLRGMRNHAHEAAELAQLRATADQLPTADVIRRGDALAHASWPGASDAALWLADWSCRIGHHADAQARYAQLHDDPLALRNAAGCAIDAHDWALAARLAQQLPSNDEVERAVRTDLLTSAARGRRRDQLYLASWLALALALAALLGSLVEAMLRGGLRLPRWRPPIEVMFLAPVAAVIVLVSFTANRAIAPAVTRISIVGLALGWLSGGVLDLLRARGRGVRARAVLHVVACVLGVLAVGYIAMTHDGLLDMLADTVRFGPGA